jgi:hypothetical protein
LDEQQGDGPIEMLSDLLHRTHVAHARFESEELGGVRDEQWPEWYANYMLANGADRIAGGASPVTEDNLAAALRAAEREHQAAGGHAHWPHYYARRLLEQFG